MLWNVLVVDDEPDNAALIESILESRAHCDLMSTGTDAVEAFKRAFKMNRRYDIVLLDFAMPEKDGLQVLDEIRAFEESQGIRLGAGVPIIMVTAHPSVFMKSFNKGTDDFILKPIDGDALIKSIESRIKE